MKKIIIVILIALLSIVSLGYIIYAFFTGVGFGTIIGSL